LILVRETTNFAANLASIEAYWDTCQYPAGNLKLLNELNQPVMGNLERHPRIDRNFLQRQSNSVEAQTRLQKIDSLLRTLDTDTARAEVREYVMTDYLLLYALVGEVIYLLAIKHHKQLSFDIDL
jgi:hypothetical protein